MIIDKEGVPRDKNPVPFSNRDKIPLKNALCPHYVDCLNLAVRAQWPQFTCLGCSFRKLQVEKIPDPDEMEGYYRLLGRIFRG
jgi:hypothetical protein